MKAYDARAVANFLLDYADQRGMKVTLLSVLKMIYYAHGWYLSLKRRPLIEQPFEAWQHGPVVRAVWESFKGSGRAALTSRAMRFDAVRHSFSEIQDPIGLEEQAFLRNILDAYGHVDAFDLSTMTHVAGSPWDRVWNAPDGAISVGMRIKDEEIRKWFSAMQAPGSLH